MTKALTALIAAVALSALAVGCGDDKNSSTVGNATDVAFINDMTAHHKTAIDMAKIAETRGEHPEIRRLAANIVKAQEGEISVMHTIGRDMHSMSAHGGHMGMSEAQMGMTTNPDALTKAKPFDKAFIEAMIPHHEGAIAMSRVLLKKGRQSGLRRIAEDIISAQRKEIAQMRRWRAQWYGSGAGHESMNMHG